MARDLELPISTPADTRGLTDTAEAVEELAEGVEDLGDATEETGRDAERLQRKIDATQRKVRELASEIARTDDEARRADLEKAFGDESRTLAKLRRVAKALDDVGDEAKTAQLRVDDLGDELQRVDRIDVDLGSKVSGIGNKVDGLFNAVNTKAKSSDADRAGSSFGRLFTSGFGSTLLNPLIGIPAAVAAVLSLPVLSAGVAAATLAGGALGAIFAGAFALRADPKLQAAASGLMKRIGDVFTKAAQPLRDPLIKALGTIGDAFEKVAPDIRAMFEAVAPMVPILAEGVGNFIKALMPALSEALPGALPVIEQIAFALPDLGNALGQFAISMSLVAPQAADFIGKLLRGLADLIRVTGDAIEFMARMWNGFVTIIRGVGQAISDVVLGIQVIFEAFRGNTERLEVAIGEALRRLIRWWKGLPTEITQALGNMGSLLFDAGRNVVQGLIDGMRSRIPSLGGVAASMAQIIRNYLPFSPAKTGPLSGSGSPDIAGRKIGEMLASGITASAPLVGAASGAMAGAVGLPAGMPHPAMASGGNSGPVRATVSYAGPTNGLDGLFASWFAEQVRTGRIRLEVRSGQTLVTVG